MAAVDVDAYDGYGLLFSHVQIAFGQGLETARLETLLDVNTRIRLAGHTWRPKSAPEGVPMTAAAVDRQEAILRAAIAFRDICRDLEPESDAPDPADE